MLGVTATGSHPNQWVVETLLVAKYYGKRNKAWGCLVLTSRLPTCDVVAGWHGLCWAICYSGSPAHMRWIADVLKLARNAKRIGAILTIPSVNMELSENSNCYIIHCVRRWFSHKIFSSPTTAGLPEKLNSVQQFNFAGKQAVNAWDRLWFGDKLMFTL